MAAVNEMKEYFINWPRTPISACNMIWSNENVQKDIIIAMNCFTGDDIWISKIRNILTIYIIM